MFSPSEHTLKTMRVHGTAIAWQDQGALFLGASGSGKSSIALHMIALGCTLIADDQTELIGSESTLRARSPSAIEGQIEARGFGILEASSSQDVSICCCVDLDIDETERLPPLRYKEFGGFKIRLFHKPGIALLPFALLQYLKSQHMLA